MHLIREPCVAGEKQDDADQNEGQAQPGPQANAPPAPVETQQARAKPIIQYA